MLSDSLKAYIDECKKNGISLERLLVDLAAVGWPDDQINHAREYYINPGIYATPSPQPVPDLLPANPPVTETVPAVPVHTKSSSFKPLAIGIGVLVFLLSAAGVGAYMVAAEKIPVKSARFQQSVASVVFRLPFIPKTPKYILQASAAAHQKVERAGFDLSVAAKIPTAGSGVIPGSDLFGMLGTGSLDVLVKGYSDISDLDNPKFSLTANIGKDIEIQTVKPDPNYYFKINKLPLTLYAVMQLDPVVLQPILANWIMIDGTPLQTEARAALDSQPKENDSQLNQAVQRFSDSLTTKKIMTQIKMASDTVDGVAAYRLEYAPTNAQLDEVSAEIQQVFGSSLPSYNSDEKLSDTVKNLRVKYWVGKQDHYVRRIEVNLDYVYSSYGESGQVIPVTTVMKMFDFGKQMDFTAPPSSITLEQFQQEMMKASGLFGVVQKAEDAKVQSDISQVYIASQAYFAVNEKYPTTIQQLVTAGELSVSSLSELEKQEIKFKVSRDGKHLLVYSTLVNENSTPGLYWGRSTKNSSTMRFSDADIAAF